MPRPDRPSFARKRPAPRTAAGSPAPLTENIIWTRVVEPRERYRIVYIDRENQQSLREVELSKVGEFGGQKYFGVTHAGKFKTMRADHVLAVLEQLTQGHAASIHAQPTYASRLPAFPVPSAVYKVPQTANAARTWTVDLNTFTCSCPERRIRSGFGYQPGQLGFCCSHIAIAIGQFLPENAAGWTQEILDFLHDPRKMHIDNLV